MLLPQALLERSRLRHPGVRDEHADGGVPPQERRRRPDTHTGWADGLRTRDDSCSCAAARARAAAACCARARTQERPRMSAADGRLRWDGHERKHDHGQEQTQGESLIPGCPTLGGGTAVGTRLGAGAG